MIKELSVKILNNLGCFNLTIGKTYPVLDKVYSIPDNMCFYFIRDNNDNEIKVPEVILDEIKESEENGMENFDMTNLFNEPDFNINTKKYIDRYNNLLKDADNYIYGIKTKLKNAQGIEMFALTSELIFIEYQREVIKQTANSLSFYSK